MAIAAEKLRRRWLRSAYAICAALTGLPSVTHAADVGFKASLTAQPVCTIVVNSDGILVQSGNKKSLSSRELGGASAETRVTANAPFSFSVVTPGSFAAAPPGVSGSLTFTHTYTGTSVMNGVDFAEQPVTTPVTLPSGPSVTDVSFDMVVDKTGAPFPEGDYTVETTFLCE